MRMVSLALVGLLSACGPKVGGGDTPSFLDIGPGAPKLCLPTVPDAGKIRGDEAEVWLQARDLLEGGDLAGAHEALLAETEHPGNAALRGIVSILAQDGQGSWETMRPLADAWPEDPCLGQVAALAAMQAQDFDVGVTLIERAVAGKICSRP